MSQKALVKSGMLDWFKNCVKTAICGDLINILNDFLTNRKQRVVLNGQCSSSVDIRAGVTHGSIFGSLLFLIYLPNGLKSKCKLFTDNTSLFSVVHDVSTSASDISNDLKLISNWTFQWKMSFNPDPSKQAQEIKFSGKNAVIPPKECYLMIS